MWSTPRPHPSIPGRAAAVGLALGLALAVTGCGGSEDDRSSSPSSSSSSSSESPSGGSGASQAPAPGDALLAPDERSVAVEGTGSRLTWRFPASYDGPPGDAQATSRGSDGTFDLLIGPSKEATPAAAAKAFADDGGDGDVEVEQLVLGDQELTVATLDGEVSVRAMFFTVPGSDTTAQLLMFSSEAVADIPQQRLDEQDQVAASVRQTSGS